MATHREIWERKREIRDAYSDGVPIEVVCERFNVEVHYVLGCLNSDEKKRLKNEMKLASKTFKSTRSVDFAHKVLELLSHGGSPESISLELKISQAKVERVLNEFQKNKDLLVKKEAAEKRLQEIIRQANCGKPMREIGESLGISGERVRRILVQAGISVRSLREKDNSDIERLTSEVSTWISVHPGCTTDEIASHFEIDLDTFDSLNLKPEAIRLILQEDPKTRNSSNLKFTKEEMLQALRTAFEIRNPMMGMYSIDRVRPLTGPYYEKLRKSERITGPSMVRVLQVFGTWRIACSLADVPSVPPVRDEYELRWTRDELIQMLADFLLQSDSHSVDAFDNWCRLDECRPSSGTIRNQVGPWSKSKREALLVLRDTWFTREE
jgi:DNA-binding CsgD family transcriptional regulator